MAKRTVFIKIEIDLENKGAMLEADYMGHEINEVFLEALPIGKRCFSKYQKQTGNTQIGNEYKIVFKKED